MFERGLVNEIPQQIQMAFCQVTQKSLIKFIKKKNLGVPFDIERPFIAHAGFCSWNQTDMIFVQKSYSLVHGYWSLLKMDFHYPKRKKDNNKINITSELLHGFN